MTTININADSLDKLADAIDSIKAPPVYFDGEIGLKSWSRKGDLLDLKIESKSGPPCPVRGVGSGESYKRPAGEERLELHVQADDVDWDGGQETWETALAGELMAEAWVGMASADTYRYEQTLRVRVSDVLADDRRALEWLLEMFVHGGCPRVRAFVCLVTPTTAMAVETASAQMTLDDAIATQTIADLVATDGDLYAACSAMRQAELDAVAQMLGIVASDRDRLDLITEVVDAITAKRGA